ncbi:MAG: hypothetical protein HC811_01620 [Flammeovirgaceae bacterium]|nr:hypothetical protein [Flammeovirgaceae bacterium]
MKRGWWILKFSVIATIVLLGITLITQYLWNWLIPDLFEGPILSFWQTAGLLILVKILTWGFGGRRYRSGGWGKWRQGWKDKWNAMSEEEREKFRVRMKEKCGWNYTSQPHKVTDTNS